MSSKYSKEELRRIAESLIDDLRECEDGMETTTGILARSNGYDDMDMDDLMELHDILFRTAKAHHITLDMSAHEGKIEGLPYNLDFVVKNKKAQVKCPFCGSRNTARLLFGLPACSEGMRKKLDEGKIALAGCRVETILVGEELVWNVPERTCNDCGKEFATPPILVAKDHGSAEFYTDIVKAVELSISQARGGETIIKFIKKQKGALVKVESLGLFQLPPDDRQISMAKWDSILDELFSHMYLHEWKKNYKVDKDIIVMDGEEWTLKVRMNGTRAFRYHGKDAYPAYWPELKKLINRVIGRKVI